MGVCHGSKYNQLISAIPSYWESIIADDELNGAFTLPDTDTVTDTKTDKL